MRDEHDLSAYCLQDDSSSLADGGDSRRIVPHDDGGVRPAGTEDGQEHQRRDQRYEGGDTAGGFGGHGRWAGGSDGEGVGAGAGAARNGGGIGGRRSYQEDGERDKNARGYCEDEEGFADAEDGDESVRNAPACFDGRQRFPSSSSRQQQSSEPSGWERPAHDGSSDENRAFGEPHAGGNRNHVCTPSSLPQHFPQHVTNSDNNNNMLAADTRARTGAGARAAGGQASKYTRGSSVFFPGTDNSSGGEGGGGIGGGRGDSVHSGGAGDDSSSTGKIDAFPSPVTPTTGAAAAYLARGGGIGNRRRSSGVREEFVTAGARAFAEEAARASSGVEQKQRRTSKQMEGETIAAAAEDFGELCPEEGKRGGEDRRPLRLGPEELTPTNGGGARGAPTSSAADGPTGYYEMQQQAWHKQQRRQPQTTNEILSRASTPGVYVASLETPHSFEFAGGVNDNGEFSPTGVDGRFGSSNNRPMTPASTCSSPGDARRGAGDREAGFRPGRLVGGVSSRLPDGNMPLSPPRHRATVADVQEAFERADTRFGKKGTDQGEAGDAGNPGNAAEGACQRNWSPQREGGASHGQGSAAVTAAGVGQAEKPSSNTIIPSGFEEQVTF